MILACLAMTGCFSETRRAIPAARLGPDLVPVSRSEQVPIDPSLLRQPVHTTHLIGPRDVLGIYVQDTVPAMANKQEPGVLNLPVMTQQDYYPPRGLVNSPAVGLPLEVAPDGTLTLPLIPPVPIVGLTIPQAIERVRDAYVDAQVLEKGRERILITLIKPRVHRVLIIRDDVSTGPTLLNKETTLLTRRGTANVLDLPAFENDVLHALVASGGLPGIDAYSAVWIYRNRIPEQEMLALVKQYLASGQDPVQAIEDLRGTQSAIRIPLRVSPGEPLLFGPQDIVLDSGDIVYLESRQKEFFFTGGLLPAAQIPLPRDYDLDILGAIALANGAVAGPAGTNAAATNFKGSSMGNVIPPTRALVVRTLPSGDRLQIRVDLKLALRDSRESVRIQSGDVVLLFYKPTEFVGNGLLNLTMLNVTFLK
jgi:hypothetical protein